MTIREVKDYLDVFNPDMEVRIGVYQDKGCSYTYGISAVRFLSESHAKDLGESCVCLVEAHNDRKSILNRRDLK